MLNSAPGSFISLGGRFEKNLAYVQALVQPDISHRVLKACLIKGNAEATPLEADQSRYDVLYMPFRCQFDFSRRHYAALDKKSLQRPDIGLPAANAPQVPEHIGSYNAFLDQPVGKRASRAKRGLSDPPLLDYDSPIHNARLKRQGACLAAERQYLQYVG
jgi:hypothetical protein